MTEGQEDLGGGELESGFVEFGSVEIGKEIQSGLLIGAGQLHPFLISKPVLVTALKPFREMTGFQSCTVGTQGLDDGWVRETVAHEEIELVTNWVGEAGDGAEATAVGGGGAGFCRVG